MKDDLKRLLKIFQEDLDLNNDDLLAVKKEIDAIKDLILKDDPLCIEIFKVTCDLITLRFKRKKMRSLKKKGADEVLKIAFKYGGEVIKEKLGGL